MSNKGGFLSNRQVVAVLVGLLMLMGSTTCSLYKHKCVHDTLFPKGQIKPMPEMTEQEAIRVLQTSDGSSGTSSGSTANDGWHPLRIFIDWTSANALVKSTPSLNSKFQLSVRLINSVKNYFGNVLQANFVPTMRFSGGECYKSRIASFVRDIDLYILIHAENDQSTDYFAAATTCYQSTRDGRPSIGAYILNFAFLNTATLYEYLYFSTFAHEFTHILGFSNDLFTSYVVPGTSRKRSLTEVTTQISISGKSFTAIKLPEVLDFAKTYYGCNTLTGVPLEDGGGDGSAGSHWEKTFLPNEYMNPTVENPGIISGFTYSLFRATGWYLTKDGGNQYYDWGLAAGCGFFSSCPGTADYCSSSTNNRDVCGASPTAKGICSGSSDFSGTCGYLRNKEHSCLISGVFQLQSNEVYGAGSRCINYKTSTGLYTTRCLPVTCSGSSLQIKVGTQTITCSESDGASSALKAVGDSTYQLECPVTTRYCTQLTTACPNDCNAKGLCTLNKQCFCYTGWSGTDCSQSVPIDYNTELSQGTVASSNIWVFSFAAVLTFLSVSVSL